MNMTSRPMAPVLDRINAIDITKFVTCVINDELAIERTINSLKKNGFFGHSMYSRYPQNSKGGRKFGLF
jgi:hypothetical protein